ncbi:hypothetical protein KA183_04970 [bacterium]|nr:hypothetical protein [bacterium]QQR56195.1 MAG: hypothetical protein IPG59_14410 [Candidatus Melainabacteria bacterium]
MSTQRLGLLAILVGVFVAGLLYSPKQKQEWKRAPDNVARFPQKLPYRYFVSDKDERSNVFFYKDNVTPRQALTDTPEGLHFDTTYDEHGFRTAWKVFYLKADGEPGQLRQDSTFTNRGGTFVQDTMYYRSGKVFQVGTLLAPDKFSKTFYREDGGVRRKELHLKRDSQWSLESAEEFDNSKEIRLVESVKRLEDGTMQLRRYKPNGKVYVMVGNSVGNATKVETWYFEDGKTPHFEVFRGDYKLTITTFDKKGRKLEEREITKPYSRGEGEMEVTFFDRQKRKTFSQRWLMEGGNYKLAAFQTYFANGQEKRLVAWGKDESGKIFIEYEQIFLSPREDRRPYKLYSHDSSGRLVRYERSWGEYSTDYTLDYEPGKGPRRSVVVEPLHIRMIPYLLPPPEVLEQPVILTPAG